MRKTVSPKPLIIIAAAAVLALPAAFAPTAASASCDGRKNTGMVLGGIGGALVGNAVSRGDTGTIVGGLAGGVIGHQVAKSGCNERRVVYRSASRRAAAPAANYTASRRAEPARKVYYDQYGQPIAPAGYAQPVYGAQAYAAR